MGLKFRSPLTRNRNAFALPHDTNSPQTLFKLTDIGKRYVESGEIAIDKTAMVIGALYQLKVATGGRIAREANVPYTTCLHILNSAIKRRLVEEYKDAGSLLGM